MLTSTQRIASRTQVVRIIGDDFCPPSILLHRRYCWLVLVLSGSLILQDLCFSKAATAQRVIIRREAICPFGYVDTQDGNCSNLGLARYTVKPSDGQSCPPDWLYVGGGYCRLK
jgi:hypothetical protein